MEPKKIPNLEFARKYTLFLNIGLIISLSVCLIAFEWKTYEDLSYVDDVTPHYKPEDDFEAVVIPRTNPPLPEPPERVFQKPQEQSTDLSNIVEVLEKDPSIELPTQTTDIPDMPITASPV